MTGIYKILHLPTNSVYIGQTSRPFQIRWNEHKGQLSDGSHKNRRLRELWSNSSPDDFKFEEISVTPSLFTPLKAQLFRAVEEIFEIKRHKRDGYKVLNITDGEAVTTKNAWNEFVKEHKNKEVLRIQNVKKKHEDRTDRRRDLEDLKQSLIKYRQHLHANYESRTIQLQKVLSRKSIFYKILGLIPDPDRRKSLHDELEKIRQKIADRNLLEKSLRVILSQHDYVLSAEPKHWEISDIYGKVKRKAYNLRNQKFELKERAPLPKEIHLDLISPTAETTSDTLDYIESFLLEPTTSSAEDTIREAGAQDAIITLFMAAYFEQAQGFLGLSIMYREGLFLHQDIERGKAMFAKALSSSFGDMEMDCYWKYELIEQHEKHLNCPMDMLVKIDLLKELSSKDFEFAQFELGVCYSEGITIPKDLMAAFELFKKATDSGHTLAMYELGLMYLDGDPVPENLSEAFRLVSVAAKAGVSDAAYTLAWMYESGSGCDIDPINAYTWYLIYSETKFSGDTEEELERVALSLTPIEIEQAQNNIKTVFE
jgi:hypothetical protein